MCRLEGFLICLHIEIYFLIFLNLTKFWFGPPLDLDDLNFIYQDSEIGFCV